MRTIIPDKFLIVKTICKRDAYISDSCEVYSETPDYQPFCHTLKIVALRQYASRRWEYAGQTKFFFDVFFSTCRS
jgi:hypothetical protein